MTITRSVGQSLDLSLRALGSYIGQRREVIPSIWYLPSENSDEVSVHSHIRIAINSNCITPELHRKLYLLKGFDLVSTVIIDSILMHTSPNSITSYCPSCG